MIYKLLYREVVDLINSNIMENLMIFFSFKVTGTIKLVTLMSQLHLATFPIIYFRQEMDIP